MKILGFIIATPVAIIGQLVIVFLLFIGYTNWRYPASDCTNNNPVFNQHEFDSKEYKEELIKQLEATRHLETDFWFEDYIDSSHFSVKIQNEALCAMGHITVDDWSGRLENIKRVEGKSYGGPIIDFQYTVIDNEKFPEIKFVSMGRIVD